MTPAISQVCTLPSTFAEDMLNAAGQPVEVWLTKLERHLETNTVESTHTLIGDTKLVAASFQGGLLASQGEARRIAWEHFKKRLDLCCEFRVPVLVLAADFHEIPTDESIARSLVSLTQAAQWAAGFNVTLALEFRGDTPFCNNLETAHALVDECGEPNLGVCLDAFHFFKGPSKPVDLQKLTGDNLTHVQLCDVPGVLRERMTDSDRVFPGEGDFHLSPIIATLKEIRYSKAVSLEMMNPVLWKSKPSQVMELGMAALSRSLSD